MSTNWRTCKICADTFNNSPWMQIRAADYNFRHGPEAAAEYVEEQLDHHAHAPLDGRHPSE